MLGSALAVGSLAARRWLRRAACGLALGSLCVLPARAALAQAADDATSSDGGWFDAPPTPPAPDYEEPSTEPEAPALDSEAPAPAQVPDSDPSALTTFRPALDPYGTWVDDSQYGTVWVPNRVVVGDDFAPYVSRGHWALTADSEWIWVSDYPFGWAVFHYGRWVWIAGHGWAWVPGRTYANAWVVWRVPYPGYDYVGWAPMPPTWGYWHGFAVGLWFAPPLPYVFCPSGYVFDYRLHHHIVHDRRRVHDIASHSRVYPTPYHAPAFPRRHDAPAPGVRAAPPPIPRSTVPRGPQLAAARVPARAIPMTRTPPPVDATRLSGARGVRSAPDLTSRQRAPFLPESRARSAPRVRLPEPARPHVPRGSVPSSPRTRSAPPRVRAPERIHVAPSPAPSRIRVEPRSPAPSRIRVSPSDSHSFAPSSHSFSPMPRTRSGSFHRR